MTAPMPDRRGRMNRSRWIAAGTSVGALVALTAGVAAANPAPDGTQHRAASTAPNAARSSVPQAPQADSSDTWGQLPPDTTPTDPYAGNYDPYAGSTDTAPQYDPGYQYSPPQYSPPQSDTRSGGS